MNIHSVNPLYIIIGEVDGSIKMSLVEWTPLKKMINLVNMKKINIKIKFSSDDDLPLNKILKLHNLTIVARSVFEEDGKYYPQVFLDESLYEL